MINIKVQDCKKVAFDCIRSYEDNSSGYLQEIVKQALSNFYSSLLSAEFFAHLGYEKSSTVIKESSNRRNGFIHKKVRSSFGSLDVKVPRDRDGSFSPIAVRKHSRAVTSSESKVLAMFAQGMVVEDVKACIHKMYSHELSDEHVRIIQNRVLDDIKNISLKRLKPAYAFVSINRIDFKVKKAQPVQGAIEAQAERSSAKGGGDVEMSLYLIQGVDEKGKPEILNIFLSPPNKKMPASELLKNLAARGVCNIVVVMGVGVTIGPSLLEQIFPYASLYQSSILPKSGSITYQ